MTVDYKEAISIADQKKKLFQEYESITDVLLTTEDYDVMGNYITYRTKLANDIDKLSKQLETMLQLAGRQADCIDYILGKQSGHYVLCDEEQTIFAITEETKAVVRRIRLKDNDLIRECERRQKENVENLKATQNTPKISRYLRNLSIPQDSLNNLGSV